MQQLMCRTRRICASSAGLSLVEVLVAAAIIAIVSVLLVYAFSTMANISMRASEITDTDAALTSDIELGTAEDETDGTIILKDAQGNDLVEFDSTFKTYTTDERSLRTFEYKDD
jgi:prepilin-type N-terminal cleavage/methylation domain-containing protein